MDPQENLRKLDISDSDKHVVEKFGGVALPEESETEPQDLESLLREDLSEDDE